jgi:hypothetical protein
MIKLTRSNQLQAFPYWYHSLELSLEPNILLHTSYKVFIHRFSLILDSGELHLQFSYLRQNVNAGQSCHCEDLLLFPRPWALRGLC